MAEPGGGEGLGAAWGLSPLRLYDYDNPESVRFRKYATGAHLVLQAGGVETGRTPGEVVWERGKARLYRYEPEKPKTHEVPILIVYALILRPYVLDLVPGNSLVEYLVGEGFDVYLLDWGFPDREDAGLSLDDYVVDYMPEAIERVLAASGAEGHTLFGYCQGGTMCLLYAALSPGVPPENLVLLAAPVDFAPEDPGVFGLWTLLTRNSEWYFDPDLLVGPSGNVPADVAGRLVESSAGLPGYAGGYANPWSSLARYGASETFLAVSKWVDDGVPFPGAAFKRWVRDFYQRNELVRGELEMRGRRVDLAQIRCPVLNIAGSKDYICPVSQAAPTTDLIGSEDKELLVVDAGHVGLMAGPISGREVRPRIRDWLGPRSR